MDCGDAGHILLSARVADDLAQHGKWQALLHDLGEVEVKHGLRVRVANLYDREVGNPDLPAKIQRAQRERKILAKQAARNRRRRWVIGLISGIALSAGIATASWIWHRQAAFVSAYKTSATGIVEKSIAVLPFDNFDDKENAYFADGVQDDILTDLAKIDDLKVISRRSVAQYRGSTQTIRDIGRAL